MAGERTELGAADVDDDVLRAMVAARLGAPPSDVELLSVRIETVDYDLSAITTGGRWWVRGDARADGVTRPWSFFVKVMQSWSRSPLFEVVPEDIREMAAAGVPWRTESLVYRSDLAARLPDGLQMPAAHGVFDLDEASASIWLEEVVVPPAAVTWDLERFGLAAHLLGRLAASPAVAELADVGRDEWTVADYLNGRLTHQVVPMLRDPDVWHHPLMAGTFDAELRERLLAAADRAADHVAELDAMPKLTGHGDACPNNLLSRPDGGRGFVLIDYGFWGSRPVGFDLGQLLVGEVQLGRRPTSVLAATEHVIVDGYVEGLRAEGCHIEPDVVRRAHALQLLIFTGLSTMPFEHFGEPPSDELVALAVERAALSRFSLDLLDTTPPV
jgi:hypothetical protein